MGEVAETSVDRSTTRGLAPGCRSSSTLTRPCGWGGQGGAPCEGRAEEQTCRHDLRACDMKAK